MEFYRAELSMGRNVMNKGPEGGWREHTGELNIAEGGLSVGLWAWVGVINEVGELGRGHIAKVL